MNLAPGMILADRFRVERLLGEGGMAMVWLVRHTALDTPYALKILTVTHPSVTERLLREGQVQGQLDHPNVVRVHDVLQLQGHSALVMDYIEGPDLDAWQAAEQPELGEILDIFRCICSAMVAAHAKGLVHRDLKPGNILMSRTLAGWHPRVADFGLAKLADGAAISRTRTGLTMGTPAYMSPEQIRDASKVDARADVFALGCILYKMTTGFLAFDGPDVMSIWMRITAGEYLRPAYRRPDLPTPVVRAIEGALAVDPDRRPQTVEALLAVLDGGTPLPGAPRGLGRPPPAWVGWAAAFAVTVAAGAVALVGATALAFLTLWGDETAPVAEATLEEEADEGDVPPEVADLPVCSGADDDVLGWARTGKVRLKGNLRKGATWTVDAPVGVSREIGQPAWCHLPKGTTVTLVQDTRRLAGVGTFAPIVGGAFEPPAR